MFNEVDLRLHPKTYYKVDNVSTPAWQNINISVQKVDGTSTPECTGDVQHNSSVSIGEVRQDPGELGKHFIKSFAIHFESGCQWIIDLHLSTYIAGIKVHPIGLPTRKNKPR
jgi:hypothetical protein